MFEIPSYKNNIFYSSKFTAINLVFHDTMNATKYFQNKVMMSDDVEAPLYEIF